MTEYDYSPEAYERYLATQNRIANWVDNTEQHRPQFENALSSVPAGSSSRSAPMPYDAHRPSKHSPAPPSPPHRSQYQHPRQLFIHPPSPVSDSSDGYGHGPGPMPLSSPPPMMMYPPQQPAYLPMGQPMVSPPPMMMHQSYTTAPHYKPSHHRHRSPHSHSRSHSQQTPAYYSMASPPVTSGYQYPYPSMTAGGHPGYFMVQPQPHGPRPMSLMSNLAEPPRSAPPNLSSFPVLPTPAGPPNSDGYFQPHATLGGSNSASAFFASTPHTPPPQGVDAWSYGAASPSHSVVSGSTDTVGVTSSTQRHYFPSIPQYQGIHLAMASPPYLPGPSQSREPLLVPQNLHQRVYDIQSGHKHYFRRSVG
ncbi:hypothetical protein CVT25_000001 [Psilocybe cyanescens]|uniref:Uncharacterized protein n=1 Tax=Psilocybe cyanescens TaxID=93625 RepID=A0A409X8J5_PSICY|nr:hypothetical protein CVT25_000001 [Psilocybe cyanescens]